MQPSHEEGDAIIQDGTKPAQWEWDTGPDLKFHAFPPGKAEFLRLNAEETAHCSLLDFINPEDARKMERALFGQGRTPRTFLHLILRYVRRDGSLVVFDTSGTPVFDDADQFRGFHGVERVIAEISPKSSSGAELHLETIYANAPIALCVVDRAGCLIAANDLHSLISGRPLAGLVGTRVADLHPESGIKIRQDFKILDAGGSVPDHEVEIGGRDYAICVTPLRDAAGNVIAISVAHFDITEQKRLERALDAANKQLAELSIRDHLTGAFNRRHFDEILEIELARVARQGGSLSMALVDADHFKRYNDLYGHVAGDRCLVALSAAIGAALPRTGDALFRYGGEEFAALLPSTDRDGAAAIGERIRKAVKALALDHDGNPPGCVTISVGIATVTAEENSRPVSITAFVERVDEALYAAKAAGRDRVVVAD